MPKEIKFYKKKKSIVLAVILVFIIVSIYFMMNKKSVQDYDFVEVKKTNIIQEVSVTGHVQARESVDLALETGGKADKINAEVGDKVQSGQVLISLVSNDLKAQLLQAQANVNSETARLQIYEASIKSEQAKLENLKKGYSPEEILLSETKVVNAKKVISDSENQLADAKEKANADLEKTDSDALNHLPIAGNTGKKTLMDITDIQYAHFSGSDPIENTLASAKEEAVFKLLGQQNAGRWISKSISTLSGGVYGEAQTAISVSDIDKTEALIQDMKIALQKVKNALNAVPVSDELTSTEKTTLDSRKTDINSEISTLSAKLQAIAVQEANNKSSISSAESALTSAKNALSTAQKELAIKQAGYTSEEIRSQQAQLEQAKANLSSQKASVSQASANVEFYKAQIEKTILKSPIDGIVTYKNAKPGEMITPNETVISIINNENYDMEADMPEVDIAKIKTGDPAKVTLDAYGNDVNFDAEVIKVDPAETIVDGVATYKTTLRFISPDERIKSGMTANIDILTAEKDGVLAVPQRAVISKDGDKIVRVLIEGTDKKESQVIETKVETGLKGSDGNIEIISGLNEGDKVVIFVKDSK